MKHLKLLSFLIVLSFAGTVQAYSGCDAYRGHLESQCVSIKEGNWTSSNLCGDYVQCLCCAEYKRRYSNEPKWDWRQQEWIEACKAANYCVECGGRANWRTQCSARYWYGPYDTIKAVNTFEFDPIPESGLFIWCTDALWKQCGKEFKTYDERLACSKDKARICKTCPVEANQHYYKKGGNANSQYCPGYGYGYFPILDKETYIGSGLNVSVEQATTGLLSKGENDVEDISLMTKSAVPAVAGAAPAGLIATFEACAAFPPCWNAVRAGGVALIAFFLDRQVIVTNNEKPADPKLVPPNPGTADLGSPMPSPEDPDGDGPKINVEHILRGEINKNGQATGFHHRGSAQGNARVLEITKPRNGNGVYEARVQIYNPNTGKWIEKLNNSTFFPDSWSSQKVISEVRIAFENSTRTGTYGWKGVSPSGISIEGWLDEAGNIVSAYPIY